MRNEAFYKERIVLNKDLLDKATRHYRLMGMLRLLFFLTAFSGVYFLWGSLLMLFTLIPGLVGFLFFVSRSVDAKYKKDKLQKIIDINERELEVLNGDWSAFKEGNDFKDPKHAFANDMDLFGKKSIYQLLNRTVSGKGARKLADQLKNGTSSVELANEAIEELSKHQEWNQNFLAEGLIFKAEDLEKDLSRISEINWVENYFDKFLRFSVPVLSSTVVALYAFELVNGTILGVYVVIILSLIGKKLKQVNKVSAQVLSFGNQVKVYRRQLQLYKELKITSPKFDAHRNSLFSGIGNLEASLVQLQKIQNRFEFRMNLLVGVLLNFLFAWDLQVLAQWQKWREQHASKLGTWEDHLAEIEVWISGGIYRHNFPETCYATIIKNGSVEVLGMGHPFVHGSKRVLNDVQIGHEQNFMIITGPNMAGKSTYLRSLGLVFICANAGFPVMARSCKIPQLKLYSSMRTSDDLTVESSYFHAELSRLRFIVDAIEKGEKVFIILDEILKGTNSKDKEIGSTRFLQKLQRLNVKGVIATHDLSLCELSVHNNAFMNMYFDSTIMDEELSFDYRIREGICKNMNASFLLKKMNLVD